MSHLDLDIVSDFDIRISSLCYINSTNSYVRIYKQIMQNKPNFRNDKMNTTLDMTSNYKILSLRRGQKTKPIQSQFKPNLTQNKPNLSQFQSQTNPICRKGNNEHFCADKEPYNDIISATRGFYHP